MTDTTPYAVAIPLVTLDCSRAAVSLSPADAAASGPLATPTPEAGWPAQAEGTYVPSAKSSYPPVPPSAPPGSGSDSSVPTSNPLKQPAKGSVFLRAEVLRFLREQKLLSQQDMADDCWRRNIRLSIATIKRTELGHAVRYRTAHEFARYFGMPVDLLLR